MLTAPVVTMLPRLRDEHGGILVTAAIFTLALILLGAAMIQVGDWFQHRRHLQVRADAAALAGGQAFGECLDTTNFTSAQAQTDIENTARQYAGFASPTGTPYNTQAGGGSDSIVFQSATYPGGGGGGPDDTQAGVGECTNMTLDVKLTDSGIPALFSFVPLGSAHAHARVQLRTVQVAKGSFPLAIGDVNPSQVGVTFVDETAGGTELDGCSGAALLPDSGCTFLLAKGSSANGLTPWSGSAGVKIPAAPGHLIGMRVGLGGQVGSCAGIDGGTGFSCWDNTTLGQGVVAIRDYASGGSGSQPNAPVLHGVWPTSGCSGAPYFSDASLGGGASCGVGVQAKVDFGTGSTNPALGGSNGGVAAALTATVDGQQMQLQPVSYDAASGDWLWAAGNGAATIPVAASGSTSGYPVTLAWVERDGSQGGNTCTSANGNKCRGTFGTVQRFTSATDKDDGPIKLVSLTEPASPSMPPYALVAGTHTLSVTVALTGNLSVQTPPQLMALRLNGNGSRTTGVNCDGSGDSAFVAAIVNGCRTPYQINANDLCPDPEPPSGPADCVPLKTGNLGNTVITALNERFGGCPANNWPDYTKPNDPRNVLLMLTDFSTLTGNGFTQTPVTDFADFYIIGWSGAPGDCGTWPFPGSEPTGGNIWGYFVKYDSSGGTPSERTCQLDEITPCVAVLTR